MPVSFASLYRSEVLRVIETIDAKESAGPLTSCLRRAPRTGTSAITSWTRMQPRFRLPLVVDSELLEDA
jgi:hypothetical protein